MTMIKHSFTIQVICAEETLTIRQSVLWPDKSIDFCRISDDEEGEHFGVFMGSSLVSVASVFYDGRSARLRKFATLSEYQGQGIGSLLLTSIIEQLNRQTLTYFWCDARESAMTFYEKFGMTSQGERFYKGDIPYRKMSLTF
ncbi:MULTISPECIES: GNAT family N-acetyltransferase [Marinomonas]|uniref:GNAT family N-acetyltransferase n=1 Tax=Marinomonas rhodophyticola TaxID=2992803 RepID=A0ABT3KB61_9GAMM|nr:GNAT family N-acetyltransferase [Marinomonas sp. KJ51-3]MCW4627770.1 GNAT family N-acetyltransferase [Marinomonas sp. KJ51-3]